MVEAAGFNHTTPYDKHARKDEDTKTGQGAREGTGRGDFEGRLKFINFAGKIINAGIMRRICRLALAIGLALGQVAVISSCGGDEPERQPGIEIPEGPRDPGGHDPGSGNEEPETEPGIEGTWSDDTGQTVLEFDGDGSFEGKADSRLGFHVQNQEIISGSYTYDSLKRWLWLNVQGKGEVYSLEFKCLITDDTMSLTDIGGNRTLLKKANK